MHINDIGFLNTISRHIMFATGSMIKNRKINNIEDGIKQVHNLHLQRGFKIMHIGQDQGPPGLSVKKYQGLQDRKVESSTYYPTPAPTPTQVDKDWVFKAWIWPSNDHM